MQVPRPALHPYAIMGGLFVLSLSLRLTLWRLPIYGDEGWYYFAAGHVGATAHNLHVMDWSEPFRFSELYWSRPLFHMVLMPFALVSFDAWRLGHIVLAALLPVLAFAILRGRHASMAISTATSLLVAVHPVLVRWSGIGFPDSLATVAFAAGLWAGRSRPLLAAALLAAAAWIKEFALVGVAGLLLVSLLSRWWETRAPPWPIQFTKYETSLLAALAIGAAPLVHLVLGNEKLPGWTFGPNGTGMIDSALLILWIAPLLLVGITWRRTRELSGVALVYVGFLFLLAFPLGRLMQAWFYVLPSFLILIALGLAADEILVRFGSADTAPRRRLVARGIALAAVFLLAVQIFVPSSAAVKNPLTDPFGDRARPSIFEVLQGEAKRDGDIVALMDQVPTSDLLSTFLVDVPWFYMLHPIGERAGQMRFGYTHIEDANSRNATAWAKLVEWGDSSILFETDSRLNAAIRETYADCIEDGPGPYYVIHGRNCSGRLETLREVYARKWESAK